jgi:hypothetical protein
MELIIIRFSMNKGALTWFRMFGAMVWNLLNIEPFFQSIFIKKPGLKIIFQFGAFLVLLESPHQV